MWCLLTQLALLLLCPANNTQCGNDVPADCEFNKTNDEFCGWEHHNWTLDHSSNNDWYAYLSNDTLSGYMKSKERCVSSNISHCLRFKFRLGRNKNRTYSLNVSISWPANNTQSLLWTYSNQTFWTNASVPVRSASNFSLIISAQSLNAKHSRDIFLDRVKYETNSCDIIPSSATPAATDPPTIKSEIPSGVALSTDVAVIVGVVAASLVIIASIVTIVVALRRRNAMCTRVPRGACTGRVNHDEMNKHNLETQSADTRMISRLNVNDDSTHANREEMYANQFPVTQRPLQSSAQRYRDSEGYEIPCPSQGNAQNRDVINVGRLVKQDAGTREQHGDKEMALESRYRNISGIPPINTVAEQSWDLASVTFTGDQGRPISDVYEISSDGANNGRQRDYQSASYVLQTSTRTHDFLDCTDAEPDRSVHTGLRVDSPAQQSAGGASVYEALQEQKDVHVYSQMPGAYQN